MSKDVMLNIKTGTGGAGFESTTGSDGTTFYYKYTGGNRGASSGGGNENKGNNDFVFSESDPVEVTFQVTFIGVGNPNPYKFADSNGAFVAKPVPATQPYSISGTNTTTTVTVKDTGAHAGDFSYGIKVVVISGGEVFTCDPMIKNSYS